MTQQFREDDEVEVYDVPPNLPIPDVTYRRYWRKAKIVRGPALCAGEFYEVQFPNGTRGVFGVAQIRLSKEQVEQSLIENGKRFLDAMGDEVKP